jgi:hypothetical protein
VIPLNPFSILTSKIFLGTTVLFALGFAVQTGRIELYFKPEIKTIRIDLEKAQARTMAEIATHKATKEAYRRAQAEAALAEAQRIARVVTEQEEITDAVTAEYGARLADARARYERLRRQAGGAGAGPAGAGSGEPVSAAGDPASGADGEAGDHGLSLDERWVATQQAIQLDALISWVEQQSVVDPGE